MYTVESYPTFFKHYVFCLLVYFTSIDSIKVSPLTDLYLHLSDMSDHYCYFRAKMIFLEIKHFTFKVQLNKDFYGDERQYSV